MELWRRLFKLTLCSKQLNKATIKVLIIKQNKVILYAFYDLLNKLPIGIALLFSCY